MNRNIVLIGFMGTGKTVVGRRLARRLERQFVDTDAALEEVTELTIPAFFERFGVVRFRSEESLLVKKLAHQSNLVIATGGGTVLNPDNVKNLMEHGILIRLTASPEVLHKRLHNIKNRPLLKRSNLAETVDRLLTERDHAYDMAEYVVDTGKVGPEQVVTQIIDYLRGREYL